MKRICGGFLFVIGLGFSMSSLAWTLNDVSVLLPLPSHQESSDLLSTRSAGSSKGELISEETYAKLPLIAVGRDRKALYDQYLKVVALRFDPCFMESGVPMDCRRQIRMVWQPVLMGEKSSLTIDASIHSFYELSKNEWDEFLKELAVLTQKNQFQNANQPLGVHPMILQEGLRGPYWQELKKLVLKYAGKENLSRLTVMTVNTVGTVWVFTGMDLLPDGHYERIKIPRIDHIAQAFFVDLADLTEFRSSINPYPKNQVAWMNFISHSKQEKSEGKLDDIRSALDQAFRIENPSLENTGTVDCASCHIAQNVRLWGERNFTGWKWGDEFKNSIYQPVNPSTESLKNILVGPGYINRLRAFGYFIDEPVVSQRLIHESIETLRSIRADQSL